MLNIPHVQEIISKIASEELEERLGVETRIGRVDFELFNKLILKDLYLEDQSGDVLFEAKRLSVGFDFLPIFEGKLLFSSAQLFSFNVNLSKETDQSPLNLKFVIDAFASKDTVPKEKNIHLQIQNLSLRRGTFSFRVKDAGQTPDRFNAKDILVNDISAKIHIDQLTNQRLRATIDKLSFFEKSGFNVKRLAFDLAATNKNAAIKQLLVELPNSRLTIEDIQADYENISSPDEYIKKTNISLFIVPSEIAPMDLSGVVPALSNFDEKIMITGNLKGNFDNFILEDFQLQESDRMMLQARIQLKDLTRPDNIYINGTIDKSFISVEGIETIANNFNNKPVTIPDQIKQLGNIRFEGALTGFFHNLTAYGIFNTDIGSISTDINIGKDKNTFFRGKVASDGLNIKKLMGDSKDYGNTSFNIQVDGIQSTNKHFSGKINANVSQFEFKGYLYENINLIGDFTDSSFKGNCDINSPEGKLLMEGLFVLNGEKSEFDFSAKANNIKLDRLNLSQKYKDSDLSFDINANFSGNNIDNLMGNINFSNVKFNTEKGGYYLDTLAIKAAEQNYEKILSINSDILHGEIRGTYSFIGIVPEVLKTANQYLPSLVKPGKILTPGKENNFSIDLTLEDTEELSYILDLPVVLYNQTKIVGQYNSIYDKFRIEAYIPKFNIQNNKFESGMILLENPRKEVQMEVNVVTLKKDNSKLPISLNVNIANDSVFTSLNWNNNQPSQYQGRLAFASKFTEQKGRYPLKTDIDIYKTEMNFNDSIWTLYPASIAIDSGKVKINNLKAEHQDQYLEINGTVSREMHDELYIALNRVNLEYIFNSLAIKALTFGGIATGYVKANDIYETRQLTTELDVKNFSFNNVNFGDLKLSGAWDDQLQGIKMLGEVIKDDTTRVDVDGVIYPVKQELSINFDAQNGDGAFLRKYLDGIAKDISGKITGNIRLFGHFSRPTFEGSVFVKGGQFGIEFLNTTYTFTDSVKMTPGEITLKNVLLQDKYGRNALVNGYVRHDRLQDFNFYAALQTENLLIYDAKEKQNPSIYGTVFGTGSAVIKGTEKLINIDVSMRSNENTKVNLNFMETEDISEYDFINFVTKEERDSVTLDDYLPIFKAKPIYLKSESGTEIKFNLNLEATPDARIELVMDPIGGDRIKGFGKGNLQIQYGTKSPLKMFGKYIIDEGSYNFSLQQIVRRDFKIKEGSSVSFRGDPYSATLDIDAIYTLIANPAELYENLDEFGARNTTVNCILNITGDMSHPNIGFDLGFPNSDSELSRQIKSLINTEDMMNRQIVYLLVLNRFYTIEYSGKSSYRQDDVTSLATSALFSKLLGDLSENFQIGTKIRTGNKDLEEGMETDTEVELLLSSQLLNNRLLINGNLGYRDNATGNQPPFVGDFDIEYKLTKTGNIRLKAYNHYDYRYYALKARTIQGIGIMFKKDFDKLEDLIRRRRKSRDLLYPALTDSTTSWWEDAGKDNFIFFKNTQNK